MSFGKGRFHLVFNEMNNFMVALHSSYLKEEKKRCWALMNDDVLVIQPSVSTRGLNVLVLLKYLSEEEKEKLKKLMKKEKIELIEVSLIRRPSEAQGFTLWVEEIEILAKVLDVFYPKRERSRVIISDEGQILIQPSVSTPELNTILYNGYNSLVGKDKKKADNIVSSFGEVIKCQEIGMPPITTNF